MASLASKRIIVLKPENVAQLVYFIRGEKVMLDADLAKLYGVSTKALNQALRRNRERFPEDFVFQLTAEEFALLRSQIVTSNAEEPDSQGLRPNWSQFVTSSRARRARRLSLPAVVGEDFRSSSISRKLVIGGIFE
jgi:ORF6N domain